MDNKDNFDTTLDNPSSKKGGFSVDKLEADLNKQYKVGPSKSTMGHSIDDTSKYDTGSLPWDDINELRGQRQTHTDKYANGLVKAAGVATTSFIEGTVGAVIGAGALIATGETSALYDNGFSRSLDSMNEYLQKAFPHYYTKEQQESIFNANFIPDKLLNGAGYMAGAIGSGMMAGKAFGALGKLAQLGKLPEAATAGDALGTIINAGRVAQYTKGAQMFGSGVLSAYGESSVEARQAKDDTKKQLIENYQKNNMGNLPSEPEMAEIERLADAAGNVDFAVNLAVTGGTNLLQFGKLMAGYKPKKKALWEIVRERAKNGSLGEFVTPTPGKLGKLARATSPYISGAIEEATQEGMQFASQLGTKDYYSRLHDDASYAGISGIVESSAKAMFETFGSKDGVESMLLGAILGAGGGLMHNENSAKDNNTAIALSQLNSTQLDSMFNKLKYATAIDSYQKDADKALESGDIFAFKNFEYDAFKTLIKSRLEFEQFDSLMDDFDEAAKLPEEEFKEALGFPKGQPLPKSKEELVADLKKEAHSVKRISDSINERFDTNNTEGILNDAQFSVLRDSLFGVATTLDNTNRRINELGQKIYNMSAVNPDNIIMPFKPQIAAQAKEYMEGYIARINKLIGEKAELNPEDPQIWELKQFGEDVQLLDAQRLGTIAKYNLLVNPETMRAAVDETVSAASTPTAETPSTPETPSSASSTPPAAGSTPGNNTKFGKPFSPEEELSKGESSDETTGKPKEEDSSEEVEIPEEEVPLAEKAAADGKISHETDINDNKDPGLFSDEEHESKAVEYATVKATDIKKGDEFFVLIGRNKDMRAWFRKTSDTAYESMKVEMLDGSPTDPSLKAPIEGFINKILKSLNDNFDYFSTQVSPTVFMEKTESTPEKEEIKETKEVKETKEEVKTPPTQSSSDGSSQRVQIRRKNGQGDGTRWIVEDTSIDGVYYLKHPETGEERQVDIEDTVRLLSNPDERLSSKYQTVFNTDIFSKPFISDSREDSVHSQQAAGLLQDAVNDSDESKAKRVTITISRDIAQFNEKEIKEDREHPVMLSHDKLAALHKGETVVAMGMNTDIDVLIDIDGIEGPHMVSPAQYFEVTKGEKMGEVKMKPFKFESIDKVKEFFRGTETVNGELKERRLTDAEAQEIIDSYKKQSELYAKLRDVFKQKGRTTLTLDEFKEIANVDFNKYPGSVDFHPRHNTPILGNDLFLGDKPVVFDMFKQKFLTPDENHAGMTLPDYPNTGRGQILALYRLPNGRMGWAFAGNSSQFASQVAKGAQEAIEKLDALPVSIANNAEAAKIVDAFSATVFVAHDPGNVIKFGFQTVGDKYKLKVDKFVKGRTDTVDSNIIDKATSGSVLVGQMNKDVDKKKSKNGIEINETQFRTNQELVEGSTDISNLVAKVSPKVLKGGSMSITPKEESAVAKEEPIKETSKEEVKETPTRNEDVPELTKKIADLKEKQKGLSLKEKIELGKEIKVLEAKLKSMGGIKKLGSAEGAHAMDIKKALDYIRKRAPKSIDVAFFDSIEDKLNKGMITFGYFKDMVINLWKGANQGTTYHELGHAIFRTMLSDKQITRYLTLAEKEIKSSRLSDGSLKEFIKERGYNVTLAEAKDLVLEEHIMERLENFITERDNGGIFKTLFRKLRDFFKFLFDKSDSLDRLFYDIDRGAFRNSEVKSNRFSGIGQAAYKKLNGFDTLDTKQMVYTLAAEYLQEIDKQAKGEDTDDEFDILTLDAVLNTFVERGYNPEYKDSKVDNEAHLMSIEDEDKQIEFINGMSTKYELLNPATEIGKENRLMLKEQVAKLLKSYGYNETSEEVEDFDEGNDDRHTFDRGIDEIGGMESLSKEVRQFIGLTLVDYVDEFERTRKKTVDTITIYAGLERALSGNPESKMMERIEYLAQDNPQIKAVFDKLINKSGWSKENSKSFFALDKDTSVDNINERMFLKRFLKAFEKESINHLQVLVDVENSGIRVISSNQQDIGTIRFNLMSENFSNYKYPEFRRNPKLAGEARATLQGIARYMNNASTSVKISNETLTDTNDIIDGVYDYLKTIGLDLHKAYLRASLDKSDKGKENKELFDDVRLIEAEDFAVIASIIGKQENPFLSENKKNGEIIDEGAVGRIKELARADAQFREDLFQTTFQSADNKTRYSYVLPSHILVKSREISETYSANDGVAIKEAADTKDFNSYNYFFNLAETSDKSAMVGSKIMKNLKTAFLGDIREVDKVGESERTREGVTYKSTDDKSFILTAHGLFAGAKKDSSTNMIESAYFITMIPEAKSSLIGVQLPVERALATGGVITDKTVDIIYDTVFTQELARIQGKFDFKSKNPNWANLAFLNNHPVEQLLGITRDKGNINNKPKNPTKAQIAEIKKAIKEGFMNEINTHKAKLEAPNTRDNPDGLNIKPLLDKATVASYGGFDNYVANFVLNDYLNSTAYNQLLQGDLSQAKNAVDRVKRNGGENASGLSMGEGTHKVAYTTEAEVEMKWDAHDGNGEQTVKVNTDDAGSDATVQYLINISYALGELKQETYDALVKLRDGIKDPRDYNKIIKNKKLMKTLDAISKKTVNYGDGRYHKESVRFLFKNFTSYWNEQANAWLPIKGKEGLHNKRVWMESNGIDKAIPASGSKLKTDAKFDYTLFQKGVLYDGQKMEGEFAYAPVDVNNKWERKQLEVHSKGFHNITTFTQAMQLIDTELGNTAENAALRQQYYDLLKKTRQNSLEMALNVVEKDTINPETGEQARDVKFFLKRLRENIENTTPDPVMEEFLTANSIGDFKYDSNLLPIFEKFQQLYLAHFSRGVLSQKSTGRKFVLVTPRDFKIIVDKTGNIITSEDFLDNPNEYGKDEYKTRELQVHRAVKDSDGKTKITYAEVAMTRGAMELYGLKLGQDIPADHPIFKGYGVRIPTQSHHSMMPFRVVEFLPEYYGDSIIIPKEIVYLSGADFDIDSLYTYMKAFYKLGEGKDAKIVEYGYASSIKNKSERDKALYDEYTKYHSSENKDVVNFVKEEQSNSPEYQNNERTIRRLQRHVKFIAKKLKEAKSPLREEILGLENMISTITESFGERPKVKYGEEDVSADKLEVAQLNAQTELNKINRELTKTEEESRGTTAIIKAALDSANAVKEAYNDKFLKAALKRFDLAHTKSEFVKMKSPLTNTALNNKLLDVMLKIVTSPELAESLATPASMTGLADDASIIFGVMRGESEGAALHNGINGKVDARRNNAQGKALVGPWANRNLSTASLTKHNVELIPAYNITFDGKVYTGWNNIKEDDVLIEVLNGKGEALTMKGIESALTANESLTTRLATGSNGHVYEDIRRKADSISSGVSAATDNAKERLMAKLNYTMQTTGVYAMMMGLGLGRTRTNLFASQPILQVYGQEVERLETAIDRGSGSKFNALAALKKKTARTLEDSFNLTKQEIDALIPEINTHALLHDINYAKSRDKDKATITPMQQKEYYMNQYKVLLAYEKLEKISSAVSNYEALLKVNKGLGSSFEEVDKIRKAAYELDLGDLVNMERLPVDKREELPFNVRPFMTQSKLTKGNVIDQNLRYNLIAVARVDIAAKKFFIMRTKVFKDMFKNIEVSLSENMGDADKFNVQKDLVTYLSLRLLKNKTKEDFNEYNKLIYPKLGGKTLVTQYRELLKDDKFKSNELIKYLRVIPAETKDANGKMVPNESNSTNMDLLVANSRNKLTPNTVELFMDSFTELLDYTNENGEQPYKDFAMNMYRYLLVKDAFQFKNNSFIRFVNQNLFRPMAQETKKFNRLLSHDAVDDAEYVKTIGQTREQSLEEFHDLFFTHVSNTKNLRRLELNTASLSGKFWNKETEKFEDRAVYEVTRDSGVLTISTVKAIAKLSGLGGNKFLTYNTSVYKEEGKKVIEITDIHFPEYFKTVSKANMETGQPSVTTIYKKVAESKTTQDRQGSSKYGRKYSASYVKAERKGSFDQSPYPLTEGNIVNLDAVIKGKKVKASPKDILAKVNAQNQAKAEKQAEEKFSNPDLALVEKIEILLAQGETLESIVTTQLIPGVTIDELNAVLDRSYGSTNQEQDNMSQSGETINIYAGSKENVQLSNFAFRPFTPTDTWSGLKFNTVEGAYQAAKIFYSADMYESNGDDLTSRAEEILDRLQSVSGAAAKKIGREEITSLNVKGWNAAAPKIMKQLMKDSFEQNEIARKALLATGDKTLTHKGGKPDVWTELFPKLLMEVRDELKPNTQTNPIGSSLSEAYENAHPRVRETYTLEAFEYEYTNLPFDMPIEDFVKGVERKLNC